MRIDKAVSGIEFERRHRASGDIFKQFEGKNYAQVMRESAAAEPGEGEVRAPERTQRSEAEKIYEAVKSGGKNPADEIRQVPKVPYGHMARDGMISYNGVVFVCDEETNSICLGDMTDKKNVITVPLSGGGYLRVHRDNLGDLSRAAGMFSPEDLNRIMRAIAKDTKIQSMKQEIDDMEAGVGSRIAAENEAAQEAVSDGEPVGECAAETDGED